MRHPQSQAISNNPLAGIFLENLKQTHADAGVIFTLSTFAVVWIRLLLFLVPPEVLIWFQDSLDSTEPLCIIIRHVHGEQTATHHIFFGAIMGS